MANPEHLALLKKGAQAWNGWRQTREHDLVILSVDLRGVDLRAAQLQEANLRGVDLRRADLRLARLRGTDLRDANLQDADLRGTDVGAADLRGAYLHGADLRQAKLCRAYLRRARLRGAQLHGADLTKADLRGALLTRANLSAARLPHANLAGADLRQSDLTKANLLSANLSKAHLNGAGLRRANLCGADLRAAVLLLADLREANLLDADLREARILGTAFPILDLTRIDGLAEIQHRGPSYIPTQTLELTAEGLTENPARRGEVEVFLRGAGVPERYLEAFGGSIGQAIEFYSCFISYSAEDQPFARRLYDGLQGRGIRCWLDEHQMLPGDDIYEQIDRGIRLWDKVLLCCSEASLTSWWVEREIEKALKKERDILKQQDRRVRALIPLALDESLFSWESGKASVILERHAADFTGYQTDSATFDREFERVVKALRTDEAKRERPPEPKL